jgi:hypothetical protein
MFGRWFGKAKVSQYFPKDTTDYTKFVAGMMDTADPATSAMCVVAIANLQPLLLAYEDVSKKTGEPFDFDRMLEGMHRRLDAVGDDPINSRRYAWFVMAMHVTRLDQIAARDAAIVEQAVGIWLRLANAGRYIPKLLAGNIVWKAEEKVWFETTRTEKDGVRYVATMMMLSAYKRHAKARAFATQHDFLLLP